MMILGARREEAVMFGMKFDFFSFLVVTQCEGFRDAIEQKLSVETPSAHAFVLRAHRALMSLHTSVLSSSCVRSVYAVRLPLGFFLPTSVMVRPAIVRFVSLALKY
jgi:hypothetical protein